MNIRPYPKHLSNPVARHAAFWILILTFFTVPTTLSQPDQFWWQLLMNLCYTPLDMFAVYVTLYALLPGVLNRKHLARNALLYLILILFVAVASNLLENHVFTFFPANMAERESLISEYFKSILMINMIIGVAVGFKLLMLWYEAQLKSQELASRQAQTELVQLREQLNPHFLFNTLNNIDNLVLHDPAKASEALIQLSDILRYSIYETSSNLVSLDKELEYLDNYIELQRIRISQPDFVVVSRSGSSSGLLIAPMLMIPLVENAFKHCYRQARSPGIRIRISIEQSHFNFTTENSIQPEQKTGVGKTGGIGIQNVKRRLDLQYPGKYSLEQSTSNNIYFSHLHLDLS